MALNDECDGAWTWLAGALRAQDEQAEKARSREDFWMSGCLALAISAAAVLLAYFWVGM